MRLFASIFPYDRWPSWEALADAVGAAEAAGLDAVALPDHLIMPTRANRPTPPVVWPEVTVLAAYLAARTSRIRLLLHALVIPYRHPVVTAKALATLDVLSGGRVTLVAGTGWLRHEFAALGVDYQRRGTLTDDALQLIHALWTSPEGEVGTVLGIPTATFAPQCRQRPHLPLWIGGSGPRPLRRVLDIGDGWAPMATNMAAIGPAVEWLHRELVRHGRDPHRLAVAHTVRVGAVDPEAITTGRHAAAAATTPDHADQPQQLPALARAAAAVGITDLGLAVTWTTPDDWVEAVARCTAVMASH